MTAVTAQQIRALQATRRKAGIDDDAWRDRLQREAGVASTKLLTSAQAARLLDTLKGGAEPCGKALKLDGPYAGICRALWISAWHLGLIRDRADTALVAFVRRQTGIEHMGWVRASEDARKVIEALKGWMSREAGVVWPHRQDAIASKLAVVAAQCRILGISVDLGAEVDPDETMRALGRCVRAAKSEPNDA